MRKREREGGREEEKRVRERELGRKREGGREGGRRTSFSPREGEMECCAVPGQQLARERTEGGRQREGEREREGAGEGEREKMGREGGWERERD